MPIKALEFDVLDVGKHIKKYVYNLYSSYFRSKRSFMWRFLIDGKENSVQMIVSYLSGKRKVVSNGSVIYEGKK